MREKDLLSRNVNMDDSALAQGILYRVFSDFTRSALENGDLDLFSGEKYEPLIHYYQEVIDTLCDDYGMSVCFTFPQEFLMNIYNQYI